MAGIKIPVGNGNVTLSHGVEETPAGFIGVFTVTFSGDPEPTPEQAEQTAQFAMSRLMSAIKQDTTTMKKPTRRRHK